MRPLSFLALMVAGAGTLCADGGLVLLHQQSGPYTVTVFASPAPPRAGMIDLSVLIQTGEAAEPVLDADVDFALGQNGETKKVRATRGQSQNKLLYSAPLDLSAGEWTYSVTLSRPGSAATVSGVFMVEGAPPKLMEYWPGFAVPFVFVVLFGIHQRLRLVQRRAPSADPQY